MLSTSVLYEGIFINYRMGRGGQHVGGGVNIFESMGDSFQVLCLATFPPPLYN